MGREEDGAPSYFKGTMTRPERSSGEETESWEVFGFGLGLGLGTQHIKGQCSHHNKNNIVEDVLYMCEAIPFLFIQ